MQYIKTVDANGNLVSVQSVSDASGAPAGAVPALKLATNQTFITQDEFNSLIAQIRGGS
ncbi:hypothetical protein JK202_10880 [Gluconobacter sp. Dm-62]|uniref:hypothetical protein n=1 Tax=Gluconobacter sp. Dm-62 TaxID=2799804 RepID=UPI001B8B1E8C|nr:hypothetical protein [Gluconobacter sp. Dm-62]MBS1103513.1 hypothetical protein [Gluconobacter sp. Dm-62]